VSSAQRRHPNAERAPGYRAIRWNMDWITRPLFGIALAGVAIGILLYAPSFIFAFLIVAITIPAAREWHRMVGAGRAYRVETAISALTVAFSVAALLITRHAWPALALVAVGALAAILMARTRRQHPLWQAVGVIYLGLPALALSGLRAFEAHGALIIIGLFLVVWATDSGALIFGNLIGGPRMAPRLSPSKTWAGTLGGSLTAALVFAGYIALLGGAPVIGGVFALLFSIVAHAGDLFESFVKRRFGIKNSGSLIPGHGGVLDRMDSTLFAAVAMALLVLLFGLNPLFGVAP
jgi:phosphatidate cytidylyltransferase